MLSEVCDMYFLCQSFEHLRLASSSYRLYIYIKIITLYFALLPLASIPAASISYFKYGFRIISFLHRRVSSHYAFSPLRYCTPLKTTPCNLTGHTMRFCRIFKKRTTMQHASTEACPGKTSTAFPFSCIGMCVLVEIHIN